MHNKINKLEREEGHVWEMTKITLEYAFKIRFDDINYI